ncbi:insulin-like receptor [Bradysia coprophila]|uniref:insulin-like receptor n=1 Tax=Bradysia coprophila TaxID=38358 RepID=UPI00187DC386|nr:insulin-like receptor [Bradysia coprophila]
MNMNILPVSVHTPWIVVEKSRRKRWTPRAFFLHATPFLVLGALTMILGMSLVDAATDDGMCRNINIMFQQSELNTLKDCRIIEGSLIIGNLHSDNETDYDGFTFPNLVEITDFMLLYNTHGLKSLMVLFPNLRVIRGNRLMNNYALIIYHLPHLQEIGLKSLTTISRGFVRISKNPELCFADTIDWTYIANGTSVDDHFIDSNQHRNRCNVCPTRIGLYIDGKYVNGSDIECPVSKLDSKKRHCWNAQTCQKICPESCGQRACNDQLECCDENCLGSCDSDGTKCTSCRHVSVGSLDARTCVDKCPNPLFMFEKVRCLTNVECLHADRFEQFIPFNGTCQSTCPDLYSLEMEKGLLTCKSCNGVCRKECDGGIIQSISDAQLYRGCTIINGMLILQIRRGGAQAIAELEEALSNIKEIRGALKITRSLPLVSLSFFKNLRVIHGNGTDYYTLYVMDNPNLESIFDHPVAIERGKLFFHFNPKLCYQTIQNIKKDVTDLSDVQNFAIEDVSINSNGDKVACSLTTLISRLVVVMPMGVIVEVESKQYDDYRVLLGYDLYFKPAPYKNVTMFDSRAACGDDGWQEEETTLFDRRANRVQIVLINLKPYTQYAYYVKTRTVASEPNGGQSEIQYFQTLPSRPGMVQKMKISPHGSSSLVVEWDQPKEPNGKLTNYVVRASLIRDDPQILHNRNFCIDPYKSHEDPVNKAPIENGEVNNECSCDKVVTTPRLKDKEDYYEEDINFENEIENLLYVRRRLVNMNDEPKGRRRRTIGTTDDFVESRMVDGHYEEFYSNTTEFNVHTFTLNQLKHYSMYLVSVQACRDFSDPYFNFKSHCSKAFTDTVRTGGRENADDIPYFEVIKERNANTGSSALKIYWPEPENPNGFIVAYTVFYKRVELDNVSPAEHCVTSTTYKHWNRKIPVLRLSNGNYSVSVRATSLLGNGRPTPSQTITID